MSTAIDSMLGELARSPQLLPPKDAAVLVATSAGMDSTVLARVLVPFLVKRGHACTLAWLDHGWRPEDAERDRLFVEQMAASLGVAVVTTSRPAPAARVRALGAEAAAREQRLLWLEETAIAVGAERIYLGHHRDDQVETILLRRLEGVPAERAASMPSLNGRLARPLLSVAKADIEELARSHGWHWLEDPSNRDLAFRRNELRHLVIPGRSAADPAWQDTVLAEGERARTRLDDLQRRVTEVLPDLLLEGSEGAAALVLDREILLELGEDAALLGLQRLCSTEQRGDRPPQRRALQSLLSGLAGARGSRLFHLGAGWTARISGDQLHLLRDGELLHESPPSGLQASLHTGRPLEWPDHGVLSCRHVSADEARWALRDEEGAGSRFAAFDLADLVLPLHVRGAGHGLRIKPFGMVGTRKVRDVLADACVPRYQRANWPVLMDAQGRVLWLPGVRASIHAPLGTHSRIVALLYTTALPNVGRISGLLRNRVS